MMMVIIWLPSVRHIRTVDKLICAACFQPVSRVVALPTRTRKPPSVAIAYEQPQAIVAKTAGQVRVRMPPRVATRSLIRCTFIAVQPWYHYYDHVGSINTAHGGMHH
jgi:hypothetical protein